jgi:branched-chain amino acid aminotransferase
MNNQLSYDGVIMAETALQYGATNRSFRYGDGVFETIRFESSELFFIDDHFERLLSGMYALGLDTTLLNPIQVCDDILALCATKKLSSARVRISVYRKEGGAYCPETDQFHIIITADEIQEGSYQFNQKGLRLGMFSEIRKPINTLSGVKSANALLYVLACRHARDNSWDEALILNENGRICEACSSNVFLVLPDKRILTPPVSEGILPGIMRKNLISWLRDNGKEVEEVILLADDFYRAEEVFLTNVISGVRWVLAFREKRYFSSYTKKMLDGFIASEVF